MKTQVLYGNKGILLSQMELIFFFCPSLFASHKPSVNRNNHFFAFQLLKIS